ncbi:Undecaprenyl phosphate-alpha-4-amino-4-deoxy-L-arabinose arabinosyl transferase [Candidatus Methylomirabilis lanthanidiphila]|uniref:Undecaprenyl phosphate-alpha-4-amino-4-deoxy-L-arabinose arabinosyl transferase n=1 Tax=Candidatus Methylomirabilis lanthanidiphila TaxID=2211376 RepID=A0A564ZK13_9BACT|nr:Undecaprenyl phosphate-alpha-4-amino-4-deoxy-L-arabinose arabinosyl transferase [Candidatus Methylomirabilis lanthanidiphila]
MCCITAFHLWFIGSGRFNLAPDEAHYWTWSKRLDWSYYSKGPAVAYLIALSTRMGGDTEFFVRLPAVLLSTGTVLLTFLLAVRLCRSSLAGLNAVLLLAAMPLAEAGSILMTIDAPLVFFWTLTLLLICRALTAEGNGWWLAAGTGLGLGLLSKYTMAFIVPQTFLYLILSRQHRFWLRRPGPYVALGVGLLLFSPVIYWNATHNVVSLRHLLEQLGGGQDAVIPLKSLGQFAASQVGVVTPVLFVVLLSGLWEVGRIGLMRRSDDAALFLFCAAVPLLVTCLIISLWTKVQGNWAAPAYVVAAIAAAKWHASVSADRISIWRWTRRRVLFAGALATGFLVSAIGHFPHALASVGLQLPAKLDLTKRLRGWAELGTRVSAVHYEMSRRRPVFVFGDRYQVASEVMFYVPDHPKTYNIQLGQRRMNQFDVWGGTEEVRGWDAIFVTDRPDLPDAVVRSFDVVQPESPNAHSEVGGSSSLNPWSIFRCYGFRGFPPVQQLGY